MSIGLTLNMFNVNRFDCIVVKFTILSNPLHRS